MQKLLGEDLGYNVCSPITSGEVDGRTFALFTKHYPFTENRFLKYIQYALSISSIINWQAEIFHKTKRKLTDPILIEKHAIEKISTIRHDESLSRATREIALGFEKAIQNKNVEVFTCFQHGDFWYGNVLFTGNPSAFYSLIRNDFRVIDWAGCIVEGYPAIDVLRLSASMFDRLGAVHWPIEKYRKKTGLCKVSFGLHCICALGFLAQNLDNFDKSRFKERLKNLAC